MAASCQANLFDGVAPLYVDTMDDPVNEMYTARPTRIYFIGRDGVILYDPGIGPFGFSPDHLEPVSMRTWRRADPRVARPIIRG